MRKKRGRDSFWGWGREMIVLRERDWVCCWWNENDEREGVILMRLRIWIVDDLYDRYLRGRCVFVCLSTMREVFCWGIWGDEWFEWFDWWKTKLKMRDGIVFLNSFLFFTLFFTSTHPLPHKTFYIPLMTSVLMIMGVIVCWSACVSSPSTTIIINTITSIIIRIDIMRGI